MKWNSLSNISSRSCAPLSRCRDYFPPELNMGSRNAMRDCMAHLISLGEETGTTFLIICHTNKRKGTFGRDGIAASGDLWDISRSVLMAGYTEDEGIRYLSNEKNNYTQKQETLLFTIVDRCSAKEQPGSVTENICLIPLWKNQHEARGLQKLYSQRLKCFRRLHVIKGSGRKGKRRWLFLPNATAYKGRTEGKWWRSLFPHW